MPIDTTTDSNHLLLNAKEARTLLGVGRNKFRRWVNTGVIPSYVDPETGWRHYSREQIIQAAAHIGQVAA